MAKRQREVRRKRVAPSIQKPHTIVQRFGRRERGTNKRKEEKKKKKKTTPQQRRFFDRTQRNYWGLGGEKKRAGPKGRGGAGEM